MPNLTISKTGIDNSTTYTKGICTAVGGVGTVLYKDTSTNPPEWKHAITTTEITAGSNGIGMQLTTVDVAGGWAIIATGGNVLIDVSVNADWTEADTAVLSETAGKIAEESEVTTMNAFKTVLGIKGSNGVASTDMRTFQFRPIPSGHQVP